jgi:TonB dependent receptor
VTTIEKRTFDIDGDSVYGYTNVRFPANLVWTFGLSYESYRETEPRFDLHKVNPKLGLQWDITNWLRLRTAFFRTLKRLLAVDQTIEPTQVAGFNQFFDDINGSQVNHYGAGIDAILTDNLYGGFEFTKRDITQPTQVTKVGTKVVEFDKQDEDLYRVYLYWTPHRYWTLSAEYCFERDALEAFELETHSVPVTLRYFSPQGFFGQLGSTFVWQEQEKKLLGKFSDEFAVVDAAIGYRLPKRRGIVSLEIRNLFDEEFRFQDLSFKTSDQFNVIHPFLPDRTLLVRITLNF